MPSLNPDQLTVKFIGNADPEGPSQPRRYTLTHSDQTGALFLSIGSDYDRQAVSGFYTRLMRDEVLAELYHGPAGPELRVYCHVSGGLVFGPAAWRYRIFKHHLRQVLQALRYGDEIFFERQPELDQAVVKLYFRSTQRRFNRVESAGILSEFRL